MATTTTTTPSTSCSVTNSVTLPTPASTALAPQASWNGDIICIDGYNATSTGTAQGYQQTLLQLPFASGNTLAIGDTSTVTLDQTLNGTAVTLYSLIFAQADNLFPVQSNGVMQNFKTGAYPAITVATPSASTSTPATSTTSATAASTPMPSPTVNAWLFYQNINAYPTSDMAQQFAQVGTSTVSTANSSSGVTSSVNTFFQATDDYTNVTLESYTLATTYLTAYAFAWANFESSYTYYMTATTSSGSTSAGTVTFTQAAANSNGFPPLTDTNGSGNSNYTITYTDAQGSATPLYFSSGQLVSDMNEEVLSICLQCNYASLSTFSNLPTDWATIVPTLCGTAFNQTVVGINWQAPKTHEDWQQKTQQALDNFFNSNGVKDFMEITGLMMGVKLVYETVEYLHKKFKNTEEENKKDVEKKGEEEKPEEKEDASKEEEKVNEKDPNQEQEVKQEAPEEKQKIEQESPEQKENEISQDAPKVENKVESNGGGENSDLPKSPMSPEQVEANRQDVLNEEPDALASQQNIANRIGTDAEGNPIVKVVPPDEVPSTQQQMATDKQAQDDAEDTDLEEVEIDGEEDELQDEAKLAVNPEMEKQASDEQAESEDLQNGEDTSADLKADQSDIKTNQQETSETYKADETEVNSATQDQVSDDEKEADDAENDEKDEEDDKPEDEKDEDSMKDDDDFLDDV